MGMETMSEPDGQLIREFNDTHDERAFAALVQRHVHLVFATALRQVGDHGTAEEVAQNVFIALAQSAGKLGRHPTLAGWLHRTTLNKSRERLRADLRRWRREHLAAQGERVRAEGDSVWAAVVPLLDEALLGLREADRQAVIMHFLEGRTFGEVGATLGVGEDAARKRVDRCLNQLTGFFRQRGFAVPALAAGTPLFVMSSSAAPAGLAASAVTAGLTAGHTAAGSSTLTLIKGALKIMAWTKAKTAAVVAVAALAGLSASTVIVHHWHPPRHHLKPAARTYPYPGDWIWAQNWGTLNRVPPLLLLQPTKLPASARPWEIIGAHYLARGKTVKELLTAIKSQKNSTATLSFPSDLPEDKYDCVVTLPKWWDALESEINQRFGLVTKMESNDGKSVMVVTWAQ
jgi:RNA polymerase sigma factor (sigma-70 family)